MEELKRLLEEALDELALLKPFTEDKDYYRGQWDGIYHCLDIIEELDDELNYE